MQTLELLAPAKNLECGKAAIDHGADAVYIGAQRFGARAAAGNSTEDIAELVRYAHLFGAKVFVTVNTIIYDEEMEDTLLLINELDKIGVDALLLQDMGLLSLLKSDDITKQKQPFWNGKVHASTQTDNRTAEKVRWLASLGFKRVVLARELSVEEIHAIHKTVPDVELEVFVHGALCVSYSGQCYASHHCFNRSANRGECAQFCRLAFTLKDSEGKIIEQDRHLLSLKDMCQLDNIERLAEAGAISFKIEGRLKDVDYVKNVTAAYSEKLNEIIRNNPDKYRRASMGRCTYTFGPNVAKSFNRGFTTYFADGRQKGLVSFDTPKAMGEYVGTVKEIRGNSFNVASLASFSNGDGLCFLDNRGQLIGFRVNRVEGNRIFPLRLPRELNRGTRLYRNYDQAFTTILSKASAERKLDVGLDFRTDNGRAELSMVIGNEHISVTKEIEMPVAEKPQEENIKRQITKLGGTIFNATNANADGMYFIPSSILSAMRRDLVCKAEEYLQKKALDARQNNCEGSAFDKQECSKITSLDAPEYPIPYLYNASNGKAKDFYGKHGVGDGDATAFERERTSGQRMLMQCRFCLRNEMGFCTKTGKRLPWREPLSLSLPDGKTFQLQFDCKNCQMNIL